MLIASNVQIYAATHSVELAERLTPDWDPESGEYSSELRGSWESMWRD